MHPVDIHQFSEGTALVMSLTLDPFKILSPATHDIQIPCHSTLCLVSQDGLSYAAVTTTPHLSGLNKPTKGQGTLARGSLPRLLSLPRLHDNRTVVMPSRTVLTAWAEHNWLT